MTVKRRFPRGSAEKNFAEPRGIDAADPLVKGGVRVNIRLNIYE